MKHIYVGGLPIVRQWPYEYKAVFSPLDVIEEYTRTARFVENGRVVTRPALTDLERVDFEGVGTLEAFNTDGLRTLIQTIPAPNMKEKTLRYPGTRNRIFQPGAYQGKWNLSASHRCDGQFAFSDVGTQTRRGRYHHHASSG